MICKKCGTEISDNSKFCLICGAKTEQGILAEKKRRRMDIIAWILAIAVLVLIFGVWYCASTFGLSKKESTEPYISPQDMCEKVGCSNPKSLYSIYCKNHLGYSVYEEESKSSSSNSSSNSSSSNKPYTNSVTIGEQNALDSAKSYLRVSAFSYSGLIEQLEYEGYTHSQAVYGADHCGANWNQQAAKSAQAYLRISSFSRTQLIEQLEYEGFTHSQAVYGVEANGY